MLNIKKFTVGQMASNCYVCWDNTDEAVIIDPGDDANVISEFILANQLTPRMIIATHGHFDHIMATLELKLAFNIPFYIHKDDLFLVNRMQETAIHYLGFDPGPNPTPDVYLKESSEIKVGSSVYKIIKTPGHTPGSVCLVNEIAKVVLVGDLVFEDGSVGRTDFSYSDEEELKKSIRAILKLPGECKVYSGHGEVSTINSLLGTI